MSNTGQEKNNGKVIAVLFVGVLMGALDISIVGPALPSIEQSLQVAERFLGWIFSIYVLFNLLGVSLFARLSDIYGRRSIYVTALAIFGLGSLWVAISSDFTNLLIGRAIQGFGASGVFPVASAVVGDLFPPEKRGRILGIIGAVFGLAFLLGPFVAGTLLKFYSWNVLFTINIPISLVLIVYSWKVLPSKSAVSGKTIDWGGIISLGVFLAALTYGLNTVRGDSIILIEVFALAGIALATLIFIERKTPHPVVHLEYFNNRQILIAGILAVSTGAMQACFVFIPSFVVSSFAVDPSTASFMLIPFVLATAIGSPVFGRLIDAVGVKRVILFALVLCSTGFYLLSYSGAHRMIYYSSGVLIGLGMSVLSGSSLRYIMLNNTKVEDRATSQGMLTIFISLGQLSATALIGVLSASLMGSESYAFIFRGTGVLMTAMFLTAIALRSQSASEPSAVSQP
ncbi:MAG: MFS transporter [Candidatus Marinimicrobia bacterium]|nr:MFS transporter [Candidatus Neomarinimicrobiota bacterium]MCF7850201.1 MFS transporter [Candidatus Neomarinimicrobiota bacterium]MCF7903757.1 MFS transporter [Candidatus Neomarinimicrobiota bacterium]